MFIERDPNLYIHICYPFIICRANICSVGIFMTRSQAGSQNDPSFSDLLHITVKIHYQTTQIASSLQHTASSDIDKHDLHTFNACSSLTTGVKTQQTALKLFQACRLTADLRVFVLRVFLNTALAFLQTSPMILGK